MTTWHTTKHPGIQVRHRKNCPAPDGRCKCAKLAPRAGGPSFRSTHPNERGKYSPVFYNVDELRTWQTDTRNAGTRAAGEHRTGDTFQALWLRWLAGAESGQISSRGKERRSYEARTLNIYRRSMARHILPTVGDRPASTLTLQDWQLLLDELRREHALSHNSLQTIFNSVRAVYRWACAPARRLLTTNAVHGLEMPAKDEVARDRIAPPDEARRLLACIAADDRCFPYDVLDFSIALYAGMRNKERWGLEWTDFSAHFRSLHIRRETTKSAAGVRTLPVIALLRPILMREWLRQGKPASGPVLRPPNGGRPVNAYGKQARRVARAWADAGLTRITPHESRHTYASYLIASGLNAKAVTVLMGHSSIEITFDRYGKLFPGHEDEAAGRLDAYLGGEDKDSAEPVDSGATP